MENEYRELIALRDRGKVGSVAEKYFVISNTNLTVRDSASTTGKEISKFSSGQRISIVEPKVEKTIDGVKWIQVYYDGQKTGWIASKYIRPDKPVETIPKATVTGTINGVSTTLYPAKKWGIPGKGDYPTDGVQKDSSGRYKVAVAPKILDPFYPDDGKVVDDDFVAFNHELTVVLKNKKTQQQKIIKCIVVDYKAHTYNQYTSSSGTTSSFGIESGYIQTGMKYPISVNGTKFAPDNIDGSIIEFAGHSIDFNPSDYILEKVISNK